MTKIILILIRIYRTLFSPLFPTCCRYYPSCSQYATEALTRYGFRKGVWMSIRRVLRCHPFHPGGYDPVR